MNHFDDEMTSRFGDNHVDADAPFMDFGLDSFLNDPRQNPYHSSEQLAADFHALSSRERLHPTCAPSDWFLGTPNPPEDHFTQTETALAQTLQANLETSPFENSVLSFDNASCFSWPSSAFPDDADRLMLDNAEATATKTPSNNGGERRKRPNLRFPRSSVLILESWLSEHNSYPYPTDRDKSDLKKETGLKRSQISSWFANARKRGKVRPLSRPSIIETVPEQPVLDLPDVDNIHPFDRWRLAPLEYEACSPAAIAKAIATEGIYPWDPVIAPHYSHTKSRRSRATSQYSGYLGQTTASVSSLEISPNGAVISTADTQSQQSLAFSETLVRRRRRRTLASSARSVTLNTNPKIQPKKFQCTFCAEFFARKHDWQRHELSQHLPLESWTCSPTGSVNVNPATNEITCVFCDAPDPTPEHIQEHGYGACIKRFPAERIFYRKDHLRQHLRLMHSCVFINSMKSWKSSALAIRSRCGFCDAKFEAWAERVSHLAEHFGNGLTMVEWIGDWGFETHVEKILERATLPEDGAGNWPKTQADKFLVSDERELKSSARILEDVKTTQTDACGLSSTKSERGSNKLIPNNWKQSPPRVDKYPFEGALGGYDFGFEGLHAFYATTESFSLQLDPSNLVRSGNLDKNAAESGNRGLGANVEEGKWGLVSMW